MTVTSLIVLATSFIALPPGGGGNNFPVWIWVVIAAVIVVGAVVMFSRSRKR
jgi:hypothetical protein